MATPAPSFTTTSSSSLRAVGQLTPTTTTTTTTTTTNPSTRLNTPTTSTPHLLPSPSHSHSHSPAPAPAPGSASTPTPTPSSTAFEFPPDYHFPPFYTRQPNLGTRATQHAKWASLILAYCAHRRLYRLSPTDELFHNRRLNRRLGLADAREVFEFMRRDGRAELVRSSGNGGNGGGGGGGGSGSADDNAAEGGGDVIWVYWRTPEEWASFVEAWVDDTAQKNTVLTLYELSHGEETVGTEFHGLDPELLQKALQVLVKRNKAQIFGQEDQLGVKFF